MKTVIRHICPVLKDRVKEAWEKICDDLNVDKDRVGLVLFDKRLLQYYIQEVIDDD
jgi:hypothetical protein